MGKQSGRTVRMTTHKTTGMTPNMAMLGHEVALPASLIAKPPDEPLEPKVPFVKDFRDTLRNAHKRVRDAMHSSAKTEKSYYDKRSKRLHFNPGQLVWLYWPKPPVRQRFQKLSQLWTGPWRIEYFKSPVVCQIVSTHRSKRVVRQIVNVDRLTACLSPDTGQLRTNHLADSDGSDASFVEPESQIPNEFDSQYSQLEDTCPQVDASSPSMATQRPTRTRRLPRSLEGYIFISAK